VRVEIDWPVDRAFTIAKLGHRPENPKLSAFGVASTRKDWPRALLDLFLFWWIFFSSSFQACHPLRLGLIFQKSRQDFRRDEAPPQLNA
jgi:hypothetical protein